MGTKVVDFMILAQNLGMEKWSNFDPFLWVDFVINILRYVYVYVMTLWL